MTLCTMQVVSINDLEFLLPILITAMNYIRTMQKVNSNVAEFPIAPLPHPIYIVLLDTNMNNAVGKF